MKLSDSTIFDTLLTSAIIVMIFSTLLRSPTSGPSRHKVNTPESTLLANDTLKVQVELDHPLWKDYVENAASFDDRMVDEWNRIVDVILVYVGIPLGFDDDTSCLSSNCV